MNDKERMIFDMTMLTHPHRPFGRARDLSGDTDAAGAAAAQARLATIRQFCMCALTIVVAGTALAAIIALEAAIYLGRFNYH